MNEGFALSVLTDRASKSGLSYVNYVKPVSCSIYRSSTCAVGATTSSFTQNGLSNWAVEQNAWNLPIASGIKRIFFGNVFCTLYQTGSTANIFDIALMSEFSNEAPNYEQMVLNSGSNLVRFYSFISQSPVIFSEITYQFSSTVGIATNVYFRFDFNGYVMNSTL